MTEGPAISKIVITAPDGERTMVFSPPQTAEQFGEAELGASISDLMHWPAGYHSVFQLAGKGPVSDEPWLEFQSPGIIFISDT